MPDQPPRVVLIEDDLLIRTAQRMLLEHSGYRVAEISTAADLAGFPVEAGVNQVIITDFDLGPGMTGIEVAVEIMRRTGEEIPTLVLSASLGERSLPAAAEHELPVMFKPATEGQVLGWIADALGNHPFGTDPSA